MATRTDGRAVEFAKCAADPAYFLNAYGVIDDAQGTSGASGTTPFRLWPAQVKVLWQFLVHRLVIILKARQLGISWLCCGYALWLCVFQPGRVVLLFSKGEVEAQELLRRIKVLYDRLPPWMIDALPARVKDNTTVQEWANGSRAQAFPASSDAGRSFTGSLVIMDEAAVQVYADRLYTAIKPTIDGGGRLIILSTANGIGNFFQLLWTAAEKRLNNFAPIFLPWWARPGRTLAWHASQVKDAVEQRTVKQEYPANAAEAFLASGSPYFNLEKLSVIATALQEPRFEPLPLLPGDLPAFCPKLRREVDTGLALSVWEEARRGHRYVIVCDVAHGINDFGDHDYSVADVWDLETWTQAAQLHGRWEAHEFGLLTAEIGALYGHGLLVIENNDQGIAVINAARYEAGYPEMRPGRHGGLYWHTRFNEYLRTERKEPGWPTDSKTKRLCLDEYAAAISDDEIHPRSRITVAESMTFVKKPGGKAGGEGRSHDDTVITVGIFCAVARQLPRRRPAGVSTTDRRGKMAA